MRWTEDVLLGGIAGGTAGCVAKTVVAPLDRIKLLYQTANPDFRKYTGSLKDMLRALVPIYRDSGVSGLFQGHSATLLRIFPYAAIKFVAYEQASLLLLPQTSRTLKDWPERHFIAGAIAGCIGTGITYPLELIRVRLAYVLPRSKVSQTKRNQALRQTCREIYAEQAGKQLRVFNFYRGCGMTLLGVVPYAGTAFLTYETLRRRMRRFMPETVANLTSGAMAGICGQTASYPFEIVRRRMQVGGLTAPHSAWLDTKTVVRQVMAEDGWRGFYKGLSIGFVKVVPMTAVSFTTWQFMRRILGIKRDS